MYITKVHVLYARYMYNFRGASAKFQSMPEVEHTCILSIKLYYPLKRTMSCTPKIIILSTVARYIS